MLTHQAIFFFRRNKNNNSNDRWFALSRRFFSLSHSLVLSFFFFSFSLCFFLRCTPSTANRYHEDILFLFLSQPYPTRIRIFDQSNRVCCRSSPRREKCVCICVCMYGCCCCFWQVAAVLPEKKMCIRKRESLSSTFVVCYMIYW